MLRGLFLLEVDRIDAFRPFQERRDSGDIAIGKQLEASFGCFTQTKDPSVIGIYKQMNLEIPHSLYVCGPNEAMIFDLA